MSKKTVVVIATSIAGLVLTSSMALALNLGILAETAKDAEEPGAVETALEPDLATAGETEPTPAGGDDATPADEFSVFPDGAEVITVYVDELVPAPTGDTPGTAATSPGAPSTAAPGAQVATPTPAPTAAAVTYPIHDVGPAGQVALQVSGNSVTFWGAYPGDGWAFMVDEEGPGEVEVEFRKGDQEVEFKAEIENGVVRVKVESESESDDDDYENEHEGRDDHDEYDDEYDEDDEDEEDDDDDEDEDDEDEDDDDEDEDD